MLYTVELDVAAGLVDQEIDLSKLAASLEKYGAQDAVVSLGDDGSLGYTAQFVGGDGISALRIAVQATALSLGVVINPGHDLTGFNVYRTPDIEVDVLEEVA